MKNLNLGKKGKEMLIMEKEEDGGELAERRCSGLNKQYD